MNPLASYARAIEAVALLVVVALIVWGSHSFLEHERQIGYDKAVAEYQQKLSEAKDAARVREQALNTQLQEARNAAAQRDQVLQAASAAAVAASGSLRDTIATLRSGLPGASAATLAHTADTLAAVLTDCQDQYRDVAAKADRHANDARTLTEAWPK